MQNSMSKYADVVVEEEKLNLDLARAFFQATTKVSNDIEDILPQEGGEEEDYSVFCIFAKLFPEVVGSNGHGTRNKRMRLHFNKLGYQIYGKEQSRRVPSLRAKPGNPGYGFKRARWRDTLQCVEDGLHCERTLRAAGCDAAKIEKVKTCVQEVRWLWHKARRPSRPAGPGRPRGKAAHKSEDQNDDVEKPEEVQVDAPFGPISTHVNSPCAGHLSRSSSPPSASTSALFESFCHGTKFSGQLSLSPPGNGGEHLASFLAHGAPLNQLSMISSKRPADSLEDDTEIKRQRLMLPSPQLPFPSSVFQNPGGGGLLPLSPPVCILPPPISSSVKMADRSADKLHVENRLPLLLPELRLPSIMPSPSKHLEMLASISCDVANHSSVAAV